jgi:hypothetical protein
MDGAKTADPRLEEIRQLRRQVEELTRRVELLELSQPESSEQTTHFEERRGSHGPAVKRSQDTGHRKAVSKALAMLGVLPAMTPDDTVDEEQRAADRAKHARSIERMQSMRGKAFVADSSPVPLPEIVGDEDVDAVGNEDEDEPAQAAPVDLGEAIPINLTRSNWRPRFEALRLLLLEAAALTAVFWFLPGANGVFVGLLLTAILAAPIWGLRAPAAQAHARLFTLVLLSRCLFPDMLTQVRETAFPNPAAVAMVACCVPGFIVVILGSVGWSIVATLMSVVLATAAGTVTQSVPVAMGVGLAAAFACIFMRRWARA